MLTDLFGGVNDSFNLSRLESGNLDDLTVMRRLTRPITAQGCSSRSVGD